MQRYLLATGVVVLLLVVGYVAFLRAPNEPSPEPPVATTTVPVVDETILQASTTIGQSVQGRSITAYSFGSGSTALLFVGGIHGGYEWNSVLLTYQTIDYLKDNPYAVPPNITIHIIPDLNPDGLYTTLGTAGRFTLSDVPSPTVRDAAGRFNANGVDLNRNFDCKWAPESTWRGQTVSAGTAPFSEPEAVALRDYVTAINPAAVAFWHSQANNVYASECENGVLPETLALMNVYAEAASYGAVASFDAYPVTGDAEGWLASIGIPAVTVELEGYETTEWERNWAGVQSWFDYFSADPISL